MISYEMYIQIWMFATSDRKYIPEEKKKDENSFLKTMQVNSYVRMNFSDKSGRPVYILAFADKSIHIKAISNFKILMAGFSKEPATVIIISSDIPSSFILKSMKVDFGEFDFFSYRSFNFIMDVKKGSKCYPHRLLNDNEKKELLQTLKCKLIGLPAISINDPQVIRLGGKVRDVVEINITTDVTGHALRYHVVIGAGKFPVPKLVPVKPSLENTDIVNTMIKEFKANSMNI